MTDIVDEIDALVEDQLRQERSGYDWNLNQVRCPHSWCYEPWHGLAITRRMREMRNLHWSTIAYYEDDPQVSPEVVAELDAYRYDQDDSEVICPGSTFTGEFEPPAPEPSSIPFHTLPSESWASDWELPVIEWPGNPFAGLSNLIEEFVRTLNSSFLTGLWQINLPDPYEAWRRPETYVTAPETLTSTHLLALSAIDLDTSSLYQGDHDGWRTILTVPQLPSKDAGAMTDAERERLLTATMLDIPVTDTRPALVIAPTARAGREYGQRHQLSKPVVVAAAEDMRGLDLRAHRLYITGFDALSADLVTALDHVAATCGRTSDPSKIGSGGDERHGPENSRRRHDRLVS